MNFRIEEVDFPKAPDGLLEKFLPLLEELTKEVYPQDPFPPKESLIKKIRNPNPNYQTVKWLVYEDSGNQIIGWADLAYETQISPSFDKNSHFALGRPYVSLKHRRLGIGSTLLEKLAIRAKESGKTVLECSTIIEAGQKFAEKYGGLLKQKLEMSRLYYDDVDWKLIHDLKNEGEEKNPTIKTEIFNEVPEKQIQEYVELYTETANQVPPNERESIHVITVGSRRLEEKRLIENGMKFISMIAKDSNGTICGITERIFDRNEPHRMIVVITGVKERFRNRGIGKRLKVEMLLHTKKKYPQVIYEHTANSTSNASMLSINKELGYKPFVAGIFYKYNIDDLIKKLK